MAGNAKSQLSLRIDVTELDAWKAQARSLGLSLTELVRLRMNGDGQPEPEAFDAEALKAEVLEITRAEVVRLLQGAAPVAPTAFDRGCFDADIHRVGEVCGNCGGSF